jgi:hypothetical protein
VCQPGVGDVRGRRIAQAWELHGAASCPELDIVVDISPAGSPTPRLLPVPSGERLTASMHRFGVPERMQTRRIATQNDAVQRIVPEGTAFFANSRHNR